MTLSNEDSFYEQNGGVKNFSFQNGTVRRYFTWPMISQRISFHERPNRLGQNKKKIIIFHDKFLNFKDLVLSRIGNAGNIRIFGGEIDDCRLQEELPGRTWWKLAKTNVTVRVPSDLMRNFGVWNDENQVKVNK